MITGEGKALPIHGSFGDCLMPLLLAAFVGSLVGSFAGVSFCAWMLI